VCPFQPDAAAITTNEAISEVIRGERGAAHSKDHCAFEDLEDARTHIHELSRGFFLEKIAFGVE
jgi:hypothetical protein